MPDTRHERARRLDFWAGVTIIVLAGAVFVLWC